MVQGLETDGAAVREPEYAATITWMPSIRSGTVQVAR